MLTRYVSQKFNFLHPIYNSTRLKQYCWDRGFNIEVKMLLNQAGSYTGPFSRWDRVQILNYGGYGIRQYCFRQVLLYKDFECRWDGICMHALNEVANMKTRADGKTLCNLGRMK